MFSSMSSDGSWTPIQDQSDKFWSFRKLAMELVSSAIVDLGNKKYRDETMMWVEESCESRIPLSQCAFWLNIDTQKLRKLIKDSTPGRKTPNRSYQIQNQKEKTNRCIFPVDGKRCGRPCAGDYCRKGHAEVVYNRMNRKPNMPLEYYHLPVVRGGRGNELMKRWESLNK